MINIIILTILVVIVIYSDLKQRDKYFAELCPFIRPSDTILDFGTGDCKLSDYYYLNTVTSIDIHRACGNADVYDGFKLPYKDKSFDVIVCLFVLHHIPHYKKILQEITRVCRKRIIIMEDWPETSYQILISKIHYLFFGQSMDCISFMNPQKSGDVC